MQVLIVEDDQRLAAQLKKGLEEQEHSCTVAFDGLVVEHVLRKLV